MDDAVWTPRTVKELVDDQHRLAATDDYTLHAALAVLRPAQESNADRGLWKAIKAELDARQNPKTSCAEDSDMKREASPTKTLIRYQNRSLDPDADMEPERALDAALDDHSTREQIDALGKLGVQNTRLGDKWVFYGWLAVFAALHFIDQHLGEPGYYAGDFIDHAVALGLSRSTAYKVRHLHQHRADFVEWGERVARDRRDKKSTKLYPTLNEMIKRHPPPPRNSRRVQPEKMTAAEKLAQAEDDADKLATENAKLQRAVQQHADEIAWLKAQPEAGAELAEAQAEIARLRAELARRPPREPPADLTPDEQLAFNLDEILSPHQTRGNPDLGARLQAEDAPIDLGPSDEPSPLDGDDEQPDPDPPPDPDKPPDPPTPDPPAPSEPAAPIVEPPTAQEFKRLLNFRWSIAEIAEKYRISPAEVERSLYPRLNDPPPIYKTVEEAIRAIYTSGKARTCASVAEVLRRLPIHEWDEDMRRRVADELWQASNPAIWQDAERVSLAEACFMYDKTAVYLFATDTEVLQFDAHGDLQIVSWTEIETMMAPHIAEQRATQPGKPATGRCDCDRAQQATEGAQTEGDA